MSSVKIFGVIAGVIQIADIGARLSVKLSALTGKARDVSKEVALTSTVLQELGDLLRRDEQVKLCSDRAIRTASETVQECKIVFSDLETTVNGNAQSQRNAYRKWTQTLMVSFKEQKIELLRSNLERLKSI